MAFELVCYLNFGYPSIEDGIKDAQLYIDNGCRALQLDIPVKDPYLEHPFIQERMKACLDREPDYEAYFDGIRRIHTANPDVAIYLMLYEKTVEEIGSEHIAAFCREVGIRYTSYVGLLERVKHQLEDGGVGICCYVQYHLPDEEVQFARTSTGPVLYQAKCVGRRREGCETFRDGVEFLRSTGLKMPIYASVGIRTPEDIRTVRSAGADGAFIGSVLMNSLHDREAFSAVMRDFSNAAKE